MPTTDQLAHTAARWWADLLARPTAHRTLSDAERADPANGPVEMAEMLADLTQPTYDDAAVEAFYRALRQRLVTAIERPYGVELHVDYSPEGLLADALDEAVQAGGILSGLPWKTSMYIRDGRIRANIGYGSTLADVPLCNEEAPCSPNP